VQVGYWKDLLEIAVRMCVSPAELKERAQQAVDRQLEVASKKYEATRSKNKQKVSCSNVTCRRPSVAHIYPLSARLCAHIIAFALVTCCMAELGCLATSLPVCLHGAITLQCKGAFDIILFLVIPVSDYSNIW